MTMKKAFIFISAVILASCGDVPHGHTEEILNNDSLVIYEIRNRESGPGFIYVAKFKNSTTTTTTWRVSQGKTTLTHSCVCLTDSVGSSTMNREP